VANISEVTRQIAPSGIELMTSHWCRMALLVRFSYLSTFILVLTVKNPLYYVQRCFIKDFPNVCHNNISTVSMPVAPPPNPSIIDPSLDLSGDTNTNGTNTAVNPDTRGHILYKRNAFWNFVDDQLVALRDTVKKTCKENPDDSEEVMYKK
jgi:hypothetical protein